jgi:drug/metabolite transporter (DMT)-like permease
MRYVAAVLAATGAAIWAIFIILRIQAVLDLRRLGPTPEPLIEWQFLIPLVGFIIVALLLKARRSGPAFAVAIVSVVMVMIFATGLAGSEFRFAPD